MQPKATPFVSSVKRRVTVISKRQRYRKHFFCFLQLRTSTNTDCDLSYILRLFTRESRMLRASLPSSGRPFVCPSVRPSVRLSVCLSVTRVSCIKTVQARITKFSLWLPQVSNLSWQNFVPLGAGVLLERGRRRGVPLKKTSFCRYWLE